MDFKHYLKYVHLGSMSQKAYEKRRRWPKANIRAVTNVSSRNARETQVSYGGNQTKARKIKKTEKRVNQVSKTERLEYDTRADGWEHC